MEAKTALKVLKAMAAKVSPDPSEAVDSAAAVVTDKAAYSALRQGIAAIESNQESVDLGDLMARQRKLMTVLGIEPGPVPEIMLSLTFKDVLIMMGGEVFETLEPLTLHTKPWKHGELDMQREHVLEELVDVLFFLLEAFELAGLSAKDVETRYENKRQTNLIRAAGKSRTVMEVAVAKAPVLDAALDVEHSQLHDALQMAAGSVHSTVVRNKLWQGVWDAEAAEAALRAVKSPPETMPRPSTILLETLSEVRHMLTPDDQKVILDELLKQLHEGMTKLVLEKSGWPSESQA